MKPLPRKDMKNRSSCLSPELFYLLLAVMFLLPISVLCSTRQAYAATSTDYSSLPPFITSSVMPNVLFILDTSNSMDEDVDGNAVGSNAPNSRSEVARGAVKTIIANNQNTMRFGLMSYKQSGVVWQYLHNGFYYASYDPATYPVPPGDPKDPANNLLRYPNPTDPGHYIYYDHASPFYDSQNDGNAFCYATDWDNVDPGTCTQQNSASCHHYVCSATKITNPPGAQLTPPAPPHLTRATLQSTYGYGGPWLWGGNSVQLVPTDSDVAEGFHEFGLEQAWVPIGPTWFSNVSPGLGILDQEVANSTAVQLNKLNALLATSQFAVATDIPLRNAGLTPLAGTFYSAQKYFSGTLPAAEAATGVSRITPVQYSCQKNFVVLVTDGLPSTDENGQTRSAAQLLAGLQTRITNLRSTTVNGFADPFDIKTYVIGFAIPPAIGSQLDALAVAGGTDVNGHAYLANNAAQLAALLQYVFLDISNQTSSGTAASVISGSQSGEGAVYQSVFYPQYTDNAHHTITWAGSVHSVFVDTLGRMREDTNQNGILDDGDQVIAFAQLANGNIQVNRTDINGNNPNQTDTEHVNYLWTSNTYLNNIPDPTVIQQRAYTSTVPGRYIFTFIDANQNGIADPGEVVDFVSTGLPAPADLIDPNKIFPYIPVNSDSTALPANAGLTVSLVGGNRDEFLENQTQRVINFIRGQDQQSLVLTTGAGGTIPAFRSRMIVDNNGNSVTWRVGDIIDSSPTVVGKPQESYHLLYKDTSYADFAARYAQRRSVVYTGANDGMMHAFNGGFYEDRFDIYPAGAPDGIPDVQFLLQPKDANGNTIAAGYAAQPLGAELWAYVPYNLLPHLYWLTDPTYGGQGGTQKHVYYVDLKPRVFDARIFTEEAICTTSPSGRMDPACIHPNGWGTVLVGGMRFGGGQITVDMNRTDGNVNTADRTMKSAYFVMDVTNPEAPPTLLGEFSPPGLGYTTCYPTAIPMGALGGNAAQNDWYLVFGSGPAEANGSPGIGTSLTQGVSSQPAKLFVVDLVQLVQHSVLKTLTPLGTWSTTPQFYQSFAGDDNAFISDPISVDYQLDYKADAVYFGTVSWSAGNNWGGKLRRIVVDNNVIPAGWVGDSVLLDREAGTHQPITAAPTASIDKDGNRWVFFGTGRYFVNADIFNIDQQAYFGIKEPFTTALVNGVQTRTWTWGTVSRSQLLDVSNAQVFGGAANQVSGVGAFTNWNALLGGIGQNSGWMRNFSIQGERNLGQAALLGATLVYTTFIPSTNVCAFGGDSYLAAVYYTTGTAYKDAMIGVSVTGERIRTKYLGSGLSSTPNIHVGGNTGSTVFVQNSLGQIQNIAVQNAGPTKSGRTYWLMHEQ